MTIRVSDCACDSGRRLNRAVEDNGEAGLLAIGWRVELPTEHRLIAFRRTGDFLWLALQNAVGVGAGNFLALLFDNERYVQGPVTVPRPINGAFPRPGDVGAASPSAGGSQRETEQNDNQQLILHISHQHYSCLSAASGSIRVARRAGR